MILSGLVGYLCADRLYKVTMDLGVLIVAAIDDKGRNDPVQIDDLVG